jgi:Tol biopolymer transport system component
MSVRRSFAGRRCACTLTLCVSASACEVEHVRLLSGMEDTTAAAGAASAGAAGAATSDAGRGVCHNPGGWLEPAAIENLGLPAQDHYGPSLTNRPAVLFYSIGTGETEDIWRAVRQPDGSFSGAAPVAEVNTVNMDGTPYITPDGRTLWFGSIREGGLGDRDIWRAEGGVNGFSAPVNVTELNSDALDHLPTLTTDGLIVMFGSRRTSSTEHLFIATRESVSEAFNAPVAVDELNVDDYDGSPDISGDGLSVLFASSRAGAGGHDIYLATRASRSDPFGAAAAVSELNSAGNDEDPRLSPAGDEVFFTSDRGDGIYRIWHALRECLDP